MKRAELKPWVSCSTHVSEFHFEYCSIKEGTWERLFFPWRSLLPLGSELPHYKSSGGKWGTEWKGNPQMITLFCLWLGQIWLCVGQLFSFSLRRGLWSNVCQVRPCPKVVFLSGVPGGDVIFWSLSVWLLWRVSVTLGITRWMGLQWTAGWSKWWKQEKTRGFRVCRGQTAGKPSELKSKLSTRGNESKDGPVSG